MSKKTETRENEKAKALESAVATISKSFGKGSIMRLGDEVVPDIEVVPTGSLKLDKALGIGGLPRGRVIEMYGPEMSGKSTLALHVIREAQKLGDTCAFIDAEHALDIKYCEKLGVNIDDLYLSQPDCGEEALEIADTLIRSGSIGVIVIDSVAALVPRAELEGAMGQSHMGLQARLMSQALRKLTASIQSTNTIVIFINQIRLKIGVLFGNPETTTGGNALKFYSSVRLDIRKKEAIKEGDVIVGHNMKVKVVKNKVAAPFREATFELLYGIGIDRLGEILDVATEKEIIEKSGSWYSYKGERIGQGRANALEFFRGHPEAAEEIEKRLED